MMGATEVLGHEHDDVRTRRRILLVEADPQAVRACWRALRESGFETTLATSGEQMDAALARHDFDLVLLSAALPDEDGFSICRRVRTRSAIPIIMMSGRSDETDRIIALELGADDYVSSTCNARVLIARFRALLRRVSDRARMMMQRNTCIRFCGWRLDPVRRQLHDPAGRRVAMTSVEIDLLLVFCRHAGRVLSRRQILEAIYGGTASSTERSIDVHVSRVRQKIEADPRDPLLIKTVRLGGYVFTPIVELAAAE
jgi:two-component system OmpR family response regulator